MKKVVDLSSMPSVLTVTQIGAVMGINRGAAYDLAHREGFPKIQIGRRIVIPKESFVAWMAAEATRR